MNALTWPELLALTGHFMLLSLLAVGGAITTASDMHRYVVAEHGWISDAQFSASIAIAQAAPGPNVLFVAVIGWNVGGLAGVASANVTAGHARLQLTEQADPNAILEHALRRVRVLRFELQRPDLQEIFVKLVGADRRADAVAPEPRRELVHE